VDPTDGVAAVGVGESVGAGGIEDVPYNPESAGVCSLPQLNARQLNAMMAAARRPAVRMVVIGLPVLTGDAVAGRMLLIGL
jgi:hypothetical protein